MNLPDMPEIPDSIKNYRQPGAEHACSIYAMAEMIGGNEPDGIVAQHLASCSLCRKVVANWKADLAASEAAAAPSTDSPSAPRVSRRVWMNRAAAAVIGAAALGWGSYALHERFWKPQGQEPVNYDSRLPADLRRARQASFQRTYLNGGKPAILTRLATATTKERLDCFRWAAKEGRTDCIDILISALQDSDLKIRRQAASILGAFGIAEITPSKPLLVAEAANQSDAQTIAILNDVIATIP